jgi:hypothetical protein
MCHPWPVYAFHAFTLWPSTLAAPVLTSFSWLCGYLESDRKPQRPQSLIFAMLISKATFVK